MIYCFSLVVNSLAYVQIIITLNNSVAPSQNCQKTASSVQQDVLKNSRFSGFSFITDSPLPIWRVLHIKAHRDGFCIALCCIVFGKQLNKYWKMNGSTTRTCWSTAGSISCFIHIICQTSSSRASASRRSLTIRAWWPRSWHRRRAMIRSRISPLPTVRWLVVAEYFAQSWNEAATAF